MKCTSKIMLWYFIGQCDMVQFPLTYLIFVFLIDTGPKWTTLYANAQLCYIKSGQPPDSEGEQLCHREQLFSSDIGEEGIPP